MHKGGKVGKKKLEQGTKCVRNKWSRAVSSTESVAAPKKERKEVSISRERCMIMHECMNAWERINVTPAARVSPI